MEQQKEPGITIALIQLVSARVELKDPDGAREYNLVLTGLNRNEFEAGKYLDVQASFDMMYGLEKPLFNFTCSFFARYERHGEHSMSWEKFSSVMALTHLIPYLREFVSNITNRLPVPVLILPPTNVHMLLANFEEHKRSSQQAIPQKVSPAPSS